MNPKFLYESSNIKDETHLQLNQNTLSDSLPQSSTDQSTDSKSPPKQEKTDKNKIYVYYYPDISNVRLRSTNEVKKYCEKDNILFNPDVINFLCKVNFQGAISDLSDLSSNAIDLQYAII